jgi:hypothetical protein
MSKQSKKKARARSRRRQRGIVLMCNECLKAQELTPDSLLERLAGALNALDWAGMTPKVRSEFIIAEGERGGGFILPPLSGSGWTRHMVTYNPSAPHYLSRREDDLDS